MSAVTNFARAHLDQHGGTFASAPPINHIQSAGLLTHVAADITDTLYSSVISIIDAAQGIQSGFYSWATVKLYYSLFYSIKALLLHRGIGMFHYDSKPGLVEIKPGGLVRKLTTGESRGGSHGSALRLFRNTAPSSVLLTPIGMSDPLEWLKSLREEVNYSLPRFTEPNSPPWFEKSVGSNTLRRVAASYSTDLILYAFDPDHAALALPLLAARTAILEAAALGNPIPADDISFIGKSIKDDSGPITSLLSILSLH